MNTLYSMQNSGNSYKCRLISALTQQDLNVINVDPKRGDTRSESYLKLNTLGKAPILITQNNAIISESNAILFYLAQSTSFWPEDVVLQTKTLSWMFFEQYDHEPSIAVRQSALMRGETDEALLQKLEYKGYRALDRMEEHLKDNSYFGEEQPSIADIALFAYTHNAHKGGFDLDKYPAILNWIEAIQSLAHFKSYEWQAALHKEFSNS